MKIKRFIGKTNQEAMYKLKKELGENAVILHTRKIRKPGIMGFIKKPIIEIVAAVDDNKAKEEYMKKEIKTKQLNDNIIINKQNNNLSNIDLEIKRLRNEMKFFMSQIGKNEQSLPSKLEKYREIMEQNGIEDNIAIKILKDINDKVNINIMDEKTIKDVILYNINEYLGKSYPLVPANNQKVIFFIGPTGVGKTTTLAKIAAQLCIKNQNEVGLITTDTYRIAAVDQLKAYSEILSIPLKVVYDLKEIYKVLANLKDKRFILVDTAGRNHKDKNKLNEIKELLQTVNNKEVYLVLSATTDFNNIKTILDRYSFIKDYKIIFTKLDEADNLGIILNTKFYANKPLSYVTMGQNVPEDIELANIQKLSKTLIGELGYERPS
ncbi:flagellar biosynthesis protein FlhF [Thermohalobacter berrensis]|uniref:Flagellar biosynthesis protein FlhF n=1 Tax=Thermohalobacter berrensis TaxID=99594 RepID=A0A419TAF9_9FIRM|nr:flagellar biosynthesis protein FlhF [Thermohalobacter berrensis]RKD34453.1 flagellar biosynthesis protein FlhF [Thermohalobacter berrensis]